MLKHFCDMASACCVASMSSWDGHFDACRPRSIFSHARVAGENDETPFAAPAAKLCEAFLTVGSGEPLFVFYLFRFVLPIQSFYRFNRFTDSIVLPIQSFYRFNKSGDPCTLHGSPLLCPFFDFSRGGGEWAADVDAAEGHVGRPAHEQLDRVDALHRAKGIHQ